MKALRVLAYGGAEQCRWEEVDAPLPGPGQVRLRVQMGGLNFIDVHLRLGRYARSQTYPNQLPLTLGMEAAGVVETVGEGVEGWKPGDRAAWCLVAGSFAERAVVPADRLVPVPEGVDWGTAAALMLQGLTAHYLAHSVTTLGPDSTVLVHAAAGGVGGLLVQLARARGATVIGTAGSPEKAARAQALGCAHVILYREQDFRAEVRRLTGGRGVDVVYDSVGKDTIAGSLRSLRRRGLCVNYGGASGLVASIEPLELGEAGSVFFTRPHLADYVATTDELRGRAADLFALERAGALRVAIDSRWPLAGTADAMRHLEAGRTRGKILLEPDHAR